jgi:predicted transcriptional regulator
MARPRKPRPFRGISEAELAVLEALWKAPGPPNELQERLARSGPEWAYTTVQTLLHRLLEKGFVARKREGVAQIYSAAVDRDELLARHVSDLAERLCDGATSPLFLSLLKARRFSKGELARFRALLDAEANPKKGG